MPSQRWTKMSERLTITCPLLADATRGPARDGTEEILNSSSGSCQPLESLIYFWPASVIRWPKWRRTVNHGRPAAEASCCISSGFSDRRIDSGPS